MMDGWDGFALFSFFFCFGASDILGTKWLCVDSLGSSAVTVSLRPGPTIREESSHQRMKVFSNRSLPSVYCLVIHGRAALVSVSV